MSGLQGITEEARQIIERLRVRTERAEAEVESYKTALAFHRIDVMTLKGEVARLRGLALKYEKESFDNAWPDYRPPAVAEHHAHRVREIEGKK